MKHLIVLILSLLSIQSSYSQINELGIFLGGSNFIGDVGATNFISPDQLAFGGIYKWNRSKRHSYRFSLIYSNIEGADNQSDDPRRAQRNYKFSNKLLEASAGMEFTFLDFDLHSGKKLGTPYLYTGISVAKNDDIYFENDILVTSEDYNITYGIPMAIGFKSNFLGNIIFGFEVGARYTFSDSIDGSSPSDQSKQQHRFGNINNNDWYVFSGITLTYTFGQNPCYCVQ